MKFPVFPTGSNATFSTQNNFADQDARNLQHFLSSSMLDAALMPWDIVPPSSTQNSTAVPGYIPSNLALSSAAGLASELEMPSMSSAAYSWDTPSVASQTEENGAAGPDRAPVPVRSEGALGASLLVSSRGLVDSPKVPSTPSPFPLANALTPLTYHPYPLLPVSTINNLAPSHNSTNLNIHLAPSPTVSSRPNNTPVTSKDMHYLNLAQIAPPAHSSLASLATTVSPAAMSHTLHTAYSHTSGDEEMDDGSSEGENSEMEDDEDDDQVDGSYKERARGGNKRAKRGVASAATQRKGGDAPTAPLTKGKSDQTASTQSNGAQSSGTAPARKRGHRVTVAEFVPPDVSGLSKREARLVKNRAAAFLSRQRKREEFEIMEARLNVALEENARLKARQTGGRTPTPAPQNDAELERLKAMLQEAEARERALREELESQQSQRAPSPSPAPAFAAETVKHEEPDFTLSMPGALDMSYSPDTSALQTKRTTKEKESKAAHGPGLSLMILVFSLSLLSLPGQNQLHMNRSHSSQPTRYSYAPTGTSAAHLPMLGNIVEKWDGLSALEALDEDDMEVELEPTDGDAPTEVDDKKPSYIVDFEMPVLTDEVAVQEDGKIRVRIQPCGAPRPRGSTPQPSVAAADSPYVPDFSSFHNQESWSGWSEFLNDEVFNGEIANAQLLPADALSPAADSEHLAPLSAYAALSDTLSEAGSRYHTPPPMAYDQSGAPGSPHSSYSDVEVIEEQSSEAEKTPVSVDVALSSLPAWSRALVRAAAGEKLRAKIRLARGAKYAKNGPSRRGSKVTVRI